ncbi:MAG: Crp/Fnr family transcriptional regulator [Halothiobacillaceae bacterium]|nr:Crp/Fnr family transcriptional regulator [Halothiobacillaceae bacterium]HUN00089.1 Crp/Fnr family transcriptional regulator [Halothiobacillus sp.]
MPDAAWVNLPAPIARLTLKDQDALCKQGQRDHFVYSIRSGWVKIIETTAEGAERIVRLIAPGGFFGVEHLSMPNSVCTHSAVAFGAAEVCRIPLESMHYLGTNYPKIFELIIEKCVEQLNQSDEVIVLFSSGPLCDRIAHLLSFLARKTVNNEGQFHLPSGADFAALTGSTVESVSRVLAEMKKEAQLIRCANGLYRFAQNTQTLKPSKSHHRQSF